MKRAFHILTLIVIFVIGNYLYGCQSNHRDNDASQDVSLDKEDIQEIAEDSMEIIETNVPDSSVIVDKTLKKQTKQEIYRSLILNEIELTIPNAIDSIRKAINSFSTEYQDWYYEMDISMTPYKETPILIVIGTPGERYLYPFMESDITRYGYIIVDGRKIDLIYSGNKSRAKEYYKYIRKKNNSTQFKYRTDYLPICDNCVVYHVDITDSALVLYEKIEHW